MKPSAGIIATIAIVSVICLLLVTGCVASNDQVARPDGVSTGVNPSGKVGKMQTCLEAAGWETRITDGVLFGPELPKEQAPLYQADQARCTKETGFDIPWTADDYHRLYPLEVANHQCLLDHGFESAEPPSEQQFVEDWLAEPPVREPYQAIGQVFHGSVDEYKAATQVCPPPLWGF